ncbi:MAG TPA: hypothetical protein P5184_01040, partial [Bacteroidales bacterium]|nr:hypothetical protein [Bacteroidales bacterium]
VVLRHDIDRLPENALKMAQIEHRKGIRATYFFRTVKPVWKAEIVRQIVSLGHEVSYHYEDLSICRGGLCVSDPAFYGKPGDVKDVLSFPDHLHAWQSHVEME